MLSGRVKSAGGGGVAKFMDQGLDCRVVEYFIRCSQDSEEWKYGSYAEDFGKRGEDH